MNANLSDLTVSKGTLNPSFDPEKIDYEVSVANDITSITVTPTTEHEKANATIEGSPSDLKVGDNTIKVIVTAEDGTTTKEYTLIVTREKTVPSAPTNVTVIGGKGEIEVKFTTPADNGGSEITGYKVTSSSGITKTGTESPIIVDDLEDGTEYSFTVIAMNSEGSSEASVEVSAITVPAEPGVINVMEGNKQVNLTWAEIKGATQYKVYQSTTSGNYGEAMGTVSSPLYDVKNLTNGTGYFFVVTAINESGESDESEEVNATPKTVPTAPTNITATAGKNGKVTVQFTPPTDDGGSEITGYEVSALPGNIKEIGTESPMTITGLSNGTNYSFTVKAINSVGKSEASEESNAVSPRSTSSGGSNNGGSNDDNTKDEAEEEITTEKELTTEEKFEVLKALDIFSGYSDGLPHLEDQMTREQAAKIIVLLFGLDLTDSAQDAHFTDVNKERWSYKYIEAASKAGITNGVGNGQFNPTGNITYEQVIKMLVEGYASVKGLEIDEAGQENTGYVSDWAEKYVVAAIQWEFIEDRENYRLNATREFLVEIAYTMVQILHEK
ncbi:fibronectin type III domain-containing protein [Chengkuizengella sp. SCS-71B]|uniref:fibronectin type III domain-containing protein n=1 Tax=Chengkuizengella sp. SCS-71B TaxID=3115290 RepID=UPI0032C23FB5